MFHALILNCVLKKKKKKQRESIILVFIIGVNIVKLFER